MPETPLRFEPRANSAWLWAGFLFSNLLGFGSVGLLFSLGPRVPWDKLGDFGAWTSGILGLGHFFLIPFGMGFSAAFFWRAFERGKMGAFVAANIALSLLGAFAIFREGVICLVMAAPLLIIFQLIGAFTGYDFWRTTKWLGVSFVPLFVVALVFSGSRATQHVGTVTTTYLVQAPPAQVWRFIAGFPAIEEKPDWWLWKLGLPAPIQSVGEPKVGSARECRFSGGVSVGEKITEIVPEKKLVFIVTRQPAHPEITHHFELERGRFLLKDNGDGTTTMIGTSWYRLNVAPVWYFDEWTQEIIGRVHRRVFRHIGQLAETREPTGPISLSSPAISQF